MRLPKKFKKALKRWPTNVIRYEAITFFFSKAETLLCSNLSILFQQAAVAAAKNAHEDPYAGYTQEAQAPSAVSMDIDPATAPAVVDTTSMDTSEAETSKKRKAEEVEPTLAGSEAVKKAKAGMSDCAPGLY